MLHVQEDTVNTIFPCALYRSATSAECARHLRSSGILGVGMHIAAEGLGSMSDKISVSSLPCHRPAGVVAWNSKAMFKDPVMQDRFGQNDPALKDAASAASTTGTQIGALLKHPSWNRVDEHD